MKTFQSLAATISLAMTFLPLRAHAGDPVLYPAAIFAFQERGKGVKGEGEKVADVLFASLAAKPEIYLVDRGEMQKILDEQSLNLSGMVQSSQATRVGQLTGAKILVTGSVIEVENTIYLVAKIIGTETSEVKGVSVKGRMSDDLAALVEKLAEKVAATIVTEGDKLVPKPPQDADRVASIRKELGNAKRPSVMISVQERHVGQVVIDPAAETELNLLAKETDFVVIDPKSGSKKQAAVLITGEGFSEYGIRRGELVSVMARLEIKAIDRASGKVLAADRQTTVKVGVSEQIAGKAALQEAAAAIAERLLPKLIAK